MEVSYIELCNMMMLSVEPYNFSPLCKPSKTRPTWWPKNILFRSSLTTSSQLLKKKVQSVQFKVFVFIFTTNISLLERKTKVIYNVWVLANMINIGCWIQQSSKTKHLKTILLNTFIMSKPKFLKYWLTKFVQMVRIL